MKKLHNEEQENGILNDYRNGKTQVAIGRKFSVVQSTVHHDIKNALNREKMQEKDFEIMLLKNRLAFNSTGFCPFESSSAVIIPFEHVGKSPIIPIEGC